MNREQEENGRQQRPASGAPHAASPQTEVTRTPWRRPQLERLRVSLDTASAPGSGIDGGAKTSPLFGE